jgi:hypothetical protein
LANRQAGEPVALSRGFRKGDIAFLQVDFDLIRSSEDGGTPIAELAFPSRDETVARQLPIRFTHVLPISVWESRK